MLRTDVVTDELWVLIGRWWSPGCPARGRVKFLVDAQLPARLAAFLNSVGHDALHTSGLPEGNRSTDAQIVRLADMEARVLITKDRAFQVRAAGTATS